MYHQSRALNQEASNIFTKILVPLDGSEMAEGILSYVVQIARGMDIPITLMSAIDPDALELPRRMMGATSSDEVSPADRERARTYAHEQGGSYLTQVIESQEQRALQRLREVADRLEAQGVKASAMVTIGAAAEQIAEAAEREGCDLIAMSTHGRNLIGRGLLGSVTDKVMHSVNIPVLTITPERAGKYHQEPGATLTSLLAPLDGSDLAESALPFVEALAAKMALEVTLVKALKLAANSSAYIEGMSYAIDAEIQVEVETEAGDYLAGVAANLATKGIEVDHKVVNGSPAVAITDLSRQLSNDIIVLATHGRSGLTRWVLGSVTEALIRTSGEPVLAIPSQE